MNFKTAFLTVLCMHTITTSASFRRVSFAVTHSWAQQQRNMCSRSDYNARIHVPCASKKGCFRTVAQDITIACAAVYIISSCYNGLENTNNVLVQSWDAVIERIELKRKMQMEKLKEQERNDRLQSIASTMAVCAAFVQLAHTLMNTISINIPF